MKRDLPKYVYRKGRNRLLYFERGGRRHRIHDEPGTDAFWSTYARLLRGPAAEPTRTIRKLIELYRRSDKYRRLAANTRRSYETHMSYLIETAGRVDPATLRRVHVVQMRDALADTPTRATRCVRFLSVLLSFGSDIGWLDQNVAQGVEGLKGKRPPRQPWPQDMVDAYRAHATGRPLLMFELLIGTGQRIGDVLRMQWGHVEDGGILVRQGKTGAKLWVPFTARLSDMLAAEPRRGLFLVSQRDGRPVSYQLAWKEIRQVREAIGAQAHDVHALRHSAASELAALGLDDQHIASITGHTSSGMVRLYAGAAAQRARAEEVRDRRNRTRPKRDS